MHRNHDNFIRAIKRKKKVRLAYSTEDGCLLGKVCIPLDYNPGQRTESESNCYHFWDAEAAADRNPLILTQCQIEGMWPDKETFDSAEVCQIGE